MYLGGEEPTRSAYLPALRNLAILPTGNWRPAFDERETYLVAFPFPLPPLLVPLAAALLMFYFEISQELEVKK